MALLIIQKIKKYIRYWRPELAYLTIAKKDKNVKDILKEQVAAEFLRENYVKPYYEHNIRNGYYSKEVPHICWVYWRQGVESAPLIVQKCVNSTLHLFLRNGWEVRVINLDDAKRICNLPSYIWDKFASGYITDAHLSDLIRLDLLINNGGCWVDATVFFTEQHKIPSYLYKHEIFVYRNLMRHDNYINISNWIISACKNQPILHDTYNILLNYWKKNDITIQYYMFHIIFKMVTEMHQDIWSSLPQYSNVPPHILQTELLQEYSTIKWNAIKEISPMHKLFWKLPQTGASFSFYNELFLENGIEIK